MAAAEPSLMPRRGTRHGHDCAQSESESKQLATAAQHCNPYALAGRWTTAESELLERRQALSDTRFRSETHRFGSGVRGGHTHRNVTDASAALELRDSVKAVASPEVLGRCLTPARSGTRLQSLKPRNALHSAAACSSRSCAPQFSTRPTRPASPASVSHAAQGQISQVFRLLRSIRGCLANRPRVCRSSDIAVGRTRLPCKNRWRSS